MRKISSSPILIIKESEILEHSNKDKLKTIASKPTSELSVSEVDLLYTSLKTRETSSKDRSEKNPDKTPLLNISQEKREGLNNKLSREEITKQILEIIKTNQDKNKVTKYQDLPKDSRLPSILRLLYTQSKISKMGYHNKRSTYILGTDEIVPNHWISLIEYLRPKMVRYLFILERIDLTPSRTLPECSIARMLKIRSDKGIKIARELEEHKWIICIYYADEFLVMRITDEGLQFLQTWKTLRTQLEEKENDKNEV